MIVNKSYFAVLAGTFAAFGSLFGKLSGLEAFKGYLFVCRILFFCLMIVSNSVSLTMFTKALHNSLSSLYATVTCAATNYIISGCLGIFFFQEETSSLWWCGIGLILFGLNLVAR
ncbi:uncharacterized protein LOC108733791 [Agrilus planipennis]|uniref:Uncharacterized protein LOC108733791 n=1 Tax=Agrilus planipennis TaxID=224129 RepID=A0A1W4W9D5_AGRPL|nr:uncharacterized protein LOC108733791 [Agrilus planipennis]